MPGSTRSSVAARRARTGLASALALLLAADAAWADSKEADLLEDPFAISLGTYIVGTNTELRVNGDEIGDKINLEDTFGSADQNRFRVDGYWRFADRHKLRFLWFDWRANRRKKIKEDFVFDDVLYEADATVELNNNFAVYELAYEYAFLRRENYELTGTLGLHYTEFGVELKAKLDVNGEPVGKGTAKADADVGAPLPVLGLRLLWNMGRNFWLDGSAQYFALTYGDYDGNLQDYRVGVTWQPRKWMGVGLGFNVFDVNVDVEKDRFDGSLDWSYYGPMIYYNASF
jgi:hypothetical protein